MTLSLCLSTYFFSLLATCNANAQESCWEGYQRRVANQFCTWGEATWDGCQEIVYTGHDVSCGIANLAVGCLTLGHYWLDFDTYSSVGRSCDQNYYGQGRKSICEMYYDSATLGCKITASPILFPVEMGTCVLEDINNTEGTNTIRCWGEAGPSIIASHVLAGGPIYQRPIVGGGMTCIPFDGVRLPTVNIPRLNCPTLTRSGNRFDIHIELRNGCFEFPTTSSGGYVTYRHPDGRIVTIKPSGEVIPTSPNVSSCGKKYNQRCDFNFNRLPNQSHCTGHFVEPLR